MFEKYSILFPKSWCLHLIRNARSTSDNLAVTSWIKSELEHNRYHVRKTKIQSDSCSRGRGKDQPLPSQIWNNYNDRSALYTEALHRWICVTIETLHSNAVTWHTKHNSSHGLTSMMERSLSSSLVKTALQSNLSEQKICRHLPPSCANNTLYPLLSHLGLNISSRGEFLWIERWALAGQDTWSLHLRHTKATQAILGLLIVHDNAWTKLGFRAFVMSQKYRYQLTLNLPKICAVGFRQKRYF